MRYDLSKTLECGQVFRYSRRDNRTYVVRALDRVCTVVEHDYKLSYASMSQEDLGDFFDWDNYFSINDEKVYNSAFEVCKRYGGLVYKAAKEFSGIRILKQDPYETLISFIVSQNNNIPKIKTTINKLCKAATGRVSRFPTPDEIIEIASKRESELSSTGIGYRGEYILRAAKAQLNGDIDVYSLTSDKLGDYQEAKRQLMSLKGVGEKVANCICLYGLGYYEAYPRDVWIKRAHDEFGIDLDKYGEYAGIVQQYLFSYIRKYYKELHK